MCRSERNKPSVALALQFQRRGETEASKFQISIFQQIKVLPEGKGQSSHESQIRLTGFHPTEISSGQEEEQQCDMLCDWVPHSEWTY